jgi:hypothetical protein
MSHHLYNPFKLIRTILDTDRILYTVCVAGGVTGPRITNSMMCRDCLRSCAVFFGTSNSYSSLKQFANQFVTHRVAKCNTIYNLKFQTSESDLDPFRNYSTYKFDIYIYIYIHIFTSQYLYIYMYVYSIYIYTYVYNTLHKDMKATFPSNNEKAVLLYLLWDCHIYICIYIHKCILYTCFLCT